MHGISRIKISTIYWQTINRNLLHCFVVKLKMGKEKAGFLTPKAIANRIKAKGLQKLRWYCQMCQKQCRDEVLFCFSMLESVTQNCWTSTRFRVCWRNGIFRVPCIYFIIQIPWLNSACSYYFLKKLNWFFLYCRVIFLTFKLSRNQMSKSLFWIWLNLICHFTLYRMDLSVTWCQSLINVSCCCLLKIQINT